MLAATPPGAAGASPRRLLPWRLPLLTPPARRHIPRPAGASSARPVRQGAGGDQGLDSCLRAAASSAAGGGRSPRSPGAPTSSCPPAQPPRRSQGRIPLPSTTDASNDDTGEVFPAYGLTKYFTCVKCQPQVGGVRREPACSARRVHPCGWGGRPPAVADPGAQSKHWGEGGIASCPAGGPCTLVGKRAPSAVHRSPRHRHAPPPPTKL